MQIIESILLLLILLNPFLLIVYLADVVRNQTNKGFRGIMFRAGLISSTAFTIFALVGMSIFSNILQANFASLQIFGGIVLLIIALQFVFRGEAAISTLRGDSKQVVGTIAMPIMIGPGTLSASIIIGQRLPAWEAVVSIILAVALSVGIMILLKMLHDRVVERKEALIERYIEVAGRITALIAGTIAIELIMKGTQNWVTRF